MLNIIVAMANNNVIGNNGTIPWLGQMADDMRWFKETTMGHVVVMGRKTFDSIGKPLDGRLNYVVSTSDLDITAKNLIQLYTTPYFPATFRDMDVFVIGGAQLYKTYLPYADRLYITRICADFEGDTFFPEIDWNDWSLIDSHDGVVNSRNLYPHRFQVWGRR